MAHRQVSAPRKLKVVNTRLFDSDVRDLKKRARERGIPWQVFLRLLVHEALRRDGKVL